MYYVCIARMPTGPASQTSRQAGRQEVSELISPLSGREGVAVAGILTAEREKERERERERERESWLHGDPLGELKVLAVVLSLRRNLAYTARARPHQETVINYPASV